jgi:hypothetical protein
VPDARRVLIRWILGMQLLAFPCVAFGGLMSLIAVRPGRGSTGTKLMVLLGSCVLEGGVALICGMALRKRLERLSYSPLVVALGSCAGLFGATLVLAGLAAGMARLLSPEMSEWLSMSTWPLLVLLPIAALGLGLGSALGVRVGCRYHPR